MAELGFTQVNGLNTWEIALLQSKSESEPSLNCKVISTPGKHVAGPIIETLNDFMAAVPPTTGFVLEFQWSHKDDTAFRVYITGDTLFVKDLEEIPRRYPDIDLLMIHLGGTTIPGPHLPILMVTMDAKQGIKLVQLIKPKITLPIHFDGKWQKPSSRFFCRLRFQIIDYDVFLSSLEDFKREMASAGLSDKVVYLDRGERFDFSVRS